MSLENSLERIATALEALVGSRTTSPAEAAGVATETTKAAPPPPPAKGKVDAVGEVTPATKKTKAAPPPPAETTAPAAPAMELAELNAKLVEEFHRLGDDRAPIDKVLMSFGAQSIKELTAGDYAAVLQAVQAIPTPA